MKETYFSPVLAEIEEARHRAELIRAADDRCQQTDKRGHPCGWLAFTVARQRDLCLRPKRTLAGGVAEGFKVLCPHHTAEYDRKYPAEQRRAS